MPENPISIANQSGFPLQIAVAQEVARNPGERGWNVLFEEHSWSNEIDGQSGYIDLVVANRVGSINFVIECKRANDQSWVFLCPNDPSLSRRHCKAWWSPGEEPSHWIGWHDVPFDPTSPESPFCAVRGHDSRSPPMLERVASELVSATDAYAKEQRRHFLDQIDPLVINIPVILTTAKLEVIHFDPRGVQLSDGKIPSDADTLEVPVVRFRKQMTVVPVDENLRMNHYQFARTKENTVLVVHADRFRQFLDELDFDTQFFSQTFPSFQQ